MLIEALIISTDFIQNMKFVKSFDGTKIAYHKQPGNSKNPTLIFLHGVGGNYTTWKQELEFFNNKNYPCIAVDLRGHGQSDAPDDFERYNIEFFAKDIEAVIKKEKLKDFYFIGHSLGGGIASAFHMVSNLRASAIALIEPSIIYPFDHEHLLNQSSFTTKMLRHIAYNKNLKNKYFPHFNDVDLSKEGIGLKIHLIEHLLQITPIRSIVFTLDNGESFFKQHFKDIKKFFKTFEHPLLVITSDDDEMCLPTNAKRISDLNKEHSQFYLLHQAGHLASITHPKEVSQVLLAFFDRT